MTIEKTYNNMQSIRKKKVYKKVWMAHRSIFVSTEIVVVSPRVLLGLPMTPRIYEINNKCIFEEIVDQDRIDFWLLFVDRSNSYAPFDDPSGFFCDWEKSTTNKKYEEFVAMVVEAGCPSNMWPSWGEKAEEAKKAENAENAEAEEETLHRDNPCKTQ